MLWKRLVFSLFLFFFINTAYCSNFHEHLFSVPFKENFAPALPKILSNKLSISVKEVFKNKENWKLIAKKFWPHLLDSYDNYKSSTLDKLYADSALKEPKDFFDAFLDFSLFLKTSKETRRCIYQINENLRKAILLKASLKDFLGIFEGYFATEPLKNRHVISATCTQRFFETLEKARALKELAVRYKTKLVYRCSIKRKLLAEEESSLFNAGTLRAIDEGLLHGFDIVASMHETPEDFKGLDKLMEKDFEYLFKFADQKRLIPFLHAFEKTNEGAFYDALVRSLKKVQKPMFIEVGHVNCMTKEWLKTFKELENVFPIFHCCPSSAMYLHDAPHHQLETIAHNIRSEGFPLFIGSDGRGILPNSSYTDMEKDLEGDFRYGEESFLSQEELSLFTLNFENLRYAF